ncbi:MAG: LuxR C-terminal-related transcriptional regulator [Gammaproteobacteria bacterium]|nr:LuxR C-terminal-related transcriptional regulator [Gammaproteobacteria bacterium]
MQGVFDTQTWHAGVATLIAAEDATSIATSLVTLIGNTVSSNGTSLLAFYHDAPPQVVAHSLAPSSAKHYLDRFLAGPYLLDPLYQLALQAKRPKMCRFRDTQPDRFLSSEYYRQYVERTHLVDEMDYMLGASPNGALVMVSGRTERRYSRVELRRFKLIEPIVIAAMERVRDARSAVSSVDDDGRGMHQRLTDCFNNFGEGELTIREREITQLLLRGHSSKSIARELGIAPGTVMVHKRNLFSKLGITSQYELFSSFIDKLSVT